MFCLLKATKSISIYNSTSSIYIMAVISPALVRPQTNLLFALPSLLFCKTREKEYG